MAMPMVRGTIKTVVCTCFKPMTMQNTATWLVKDAVHNLTKLVLKTNVFNGELIYQIVKDQFFFRIAAS